MRIVLFLFKWIVALLLIFALAGFGRTLLQHFSIWPLLSASYLSFAAGAVLFFLMWVFIFLRRGGFWGVLEHELTHALFALLFFKKVHSLSARRRNGAVTIQGGNVVIALAPYFFPLLASAVLILKPLVQTQYQVYLNFILGFAYFFHLGKLALEFHPGQPDFRAGGIFFSIVIILSMNLIILGIILSTLPGDWQSVESFMKQGIGHTAGLLHSSFGIVADLISSLHF
ncbi:MAG: M50 family metallopeptidase [Calditrichia bacterium]